MSNPIETAKSIVATWNFYQYPGDIDEDSPTPCDKVTVKTAAMWNIRLPKLNVYL